MFSKSIICGVFIYFAIGFINCQDSLGDDSNERLMKKAVHEAIRDMMENCKNPETTQEDVDKFITNDDNPSYESKCFGACMMRQFGILTEDGKYDPSGLKQIFEMNESDEEMMNKRLEILEKCKGLEDPDDCETAYKVSSCLHKEHKEAGFDMGNEEV